MSVRTVAFIGLGRMGLPMATNLIRAGFEVTGCGIDPAKVERFSARGGRAAGTPRGAAAGADVSVSMVMNDAILREVALGERGVLPTAACGHVYVDRLARGLRGGRQGGRARRRILVRQGLRQHRPPQGGAAHPFCLGDAAAFELYAPVFRAMAANVHHVGEGASAAYLKLVHSLFVGVYSAMLGEALAFGRKGGLELATMIHILETGPLGSR